MRIRISGGFLEYDKNLEGKLHEKFENLLEASSKGYYGKVAGLLKDFCPSELEFCCYFYLFDFSKSIMYYPFYNFYSISSLKTVCLPTPWQVLIRSFEKKNLFSLGLYPNLKKKRGCKGFDCFQLFSYIFGVFN